MIKLKAEKEILVRVPGHDRPIYIPVPDNWPTGEDFLLRRLDIPVSVPFGETLTHLRAEWNEHQHSVVQWGVVYTRDRRSHVWYMTSYAGMLFGLLLAVRASNLLGGSLANLPGAGMGRWMYEVALVDPPGAVEALAARLEARDYAQQVVASTPLKQRYRTSRG